MGVRIHRNTQQTTRNTRNSLSVGRELSQFGADIILINDEFTHRQKLTDFFAIAPGQTIDERLFDGLADLNTLEQLGGDVIWDLFILRPLHAGVQGLEKQGIRIRPVYHHGSVESFGFYTGPVQRFEQGKRVKAVIHKGLDGLFCRHRFYLFHSVLYVPFLSGPFNGLKVNPADKYRHVILSTP